MHDGILAVRVQNTTIKFAFAILRCRWVERHFKRGGPICSRPHSDRMSLYESFRGGRRRNKPHICNSINIVRVRSGLTVFYFLFLGQTGMDANGIWVLVRLYVQIHLFATFATFAKLFTTFDRLSVIFEYTRNTCQCRFYFSRRRDEQTHIFAYFEIPM